MTLTETSWGTLAPVLEPSKKPRVLGVQPLRKQSRNIDVICLGFKSLMVESCNKKIILYSYFLLMHVLFDSIFYCGLVNDGVMASISLGIT